MAYSVYKGATDISNYVVDCPPIPLVNATHDNIITLPSMQITVIDNAVSYAKDDVIKFYDGTDCFARFIIEDIDSDYESNTKTLSLVDCLELLKRYWASEIVEADLWAAFTMDEDRDESYNNMRYSLYTGAGAPYRRPFVTLTHYIKTAIVKAGIEAVANVDFKEMYGSIASGFERWDEGEDDVAYLTKEELCFHPFQIAVAKLSTGTEEIWRGATLYDVVMFALQVLNAQIRYTGTSVKLVNRETGSAPANDDIYHYKSQSWLNTFDMVNVTGTYGVTSPAARGFAPYVGGTWPSMDISSENWSYPEDFSEDRAPKLRTTALMRHAMVHYRKRIEDNYYTYELHAEAYELGPSDQLEYMFARQLARVLYGLFPTGGVVETYEFPADPDTLGERPLLRLELDIPNRKTIMEC